MNIIIKGKEPLSGIFNDILNFTGKSFFLIDSLKYANDSRTIRFTIKRAPIIENAKVLGIFNKSRLDTSKQLTTSIEFNNVIEFDCNNTFEKDILSFQVHVGLFVNNNCFSISSVDEIRGVQKFMLEGKYSKIDFSMIDIEGKESEG